VTPIPQGQSACPRSRARAHGLQPNGLNNDVCASNRCCGGSPRARISAASSASVGANRDSADRVAITSKLIETLRRSRVSHRQRVVAEHAGTAQSAAIRRADDLLAKVIARASACARTPATRRCLLKIAPDLAYPELDDVVHIARSRKVDGMIVATPHWRGLRRCARPTARRRRAGIGAAAVRLSTRMVAETYVRAEGAFPLVGVGGIGYRRRPLTKISAPAPA